MHARFSQDVSSRQFRLALDLTLCRKPTPRVSTPPSIQNPSPLEITPHRLQETHVYRLSRSFGLDRVHWIKTCSRTIGGERKPPSAAAGTPGTIDIPSNQETYRKTVCQCL